MLSHLSIELLDYQHAKCESSQVCMYPTKAPSCQGSPWPCRVSPPDTSRRHVSYGGLDLPWPRKSSHHCHTL